LLTFIAVLILIGFISMLPETVVLPVHVDPAHSYFEVASSIVESLQITPSEFSFISPCGQTYYLNDIDAESLIHALSEQGVAYRFEEIEHSELAFFRSYNSTRRVH
jgi:hypothetical protein